MSTIVVQHQIHDAEKFFASGESVVQNAPAGIRSRQFCPSQDGSQAVCLWEADSLDALRRYVDSVSEGIAENSYYVLDQERAFGLPTEESATA